MFCPNCNAPRPNDPRFCHQCGTPLIPLPHRKKGKLWPPILFLIAMFAVGVVIFAITPQETSAPSATPWFSIEDGTLYFDPYYFEGTTLEIPSTVDGQTVTALSKGCFQDCDSLETIILPDTLETIGDYAFMGCDKLRGIKLTEKVYEIGTEAFYNCPSLEAVYVPQSTKSVGVNAFAACFKLKHVFYAGDMESWTALYPQYICTDTQIYSVSGPDADSYAPA